MKKIILSFASWCLLTVFVNAQTANIESAVVDLTDKSYESAKKYIDKAAINDETKNSAKMHYYRGYIHMKIGGDSLLALKYPDACEIALRSFIECIKLDIKKKYEERLDEEGNPTGSITSMDNAAFQCYNRAAGSFEKKDFETAIRCYNLILEAIPLDKGNNLAKNNLTATQIILYNSFAAINAKSLLDEDYANCKKNANGNCEELLTKRNGYLEQGKKSLMTLMDQSYPDPVVYVQMENIQLSEGDTAGALATIERGLKVLDNNKDLMNEELRIYQARNDMNGLINKLSKTIELDPNNGNYLLIRGNMFDQHKYAFQNKKMTREADSCALLAEKDYLKCIEINPNDTFALYSLGALYLQQGNPIIEKINGLNEKKPDYTQKLTALRGQLKGVFEKSKPYLEKAYELKSDDYDIVFALQQLYTKLEMREKADEFRKKKEQLKR